jgi:Tfp pilus assembly PilM family ATPase
MDPIQAEQYKINYGIDERQLEGKVAKAILPVLSVILEEAKRALAFFNQKHPAGKFDFVTVAGGGAEMHGLSIWLAQALNLEVLTANPFVAFIKDDKFPKEISPARFATAVGLALREDE